MRLQLIKFKKQSKNGFSLVETLVAIFILALAISAAMTVAQNSLQASFYARDRIAAFFLAQEAIELVKNKRDVNGLSGELWLKDIADWGNYGGPCGISSDCGVDVENYLAPTPCVSIENCLLAKEQNSRRVMHCPKGAIGDECGEATGWDGNFSPTIFSRKINMEKISANEARVTVTVEWTRGLGSRKLEVSEHIFNWHPFSDVEQE